MRKRVAGRAETLKNGVPLIAAQPFFCFCDRPATTVVRATITSKRRRDGRQVGEG